MIDRAMSRPAALSGERFLARLPSVGSRALEARIVEARRRGIDVLRLSPYPVRPLPEHVSEAAQRAIRENREAPTRGLPALREAIAATVMSETGRTIDPAREVVVTNGGMNALNVVFRALLAPGDEVLIPAPSYFFHGPVTLAGGCPVHVLMSEEHGFAWDHDALREAITPRTRAILISSPVNPTGYVASAADLEAVAQLALDAGLFVVSDESYDRLIYDGRPHLSPFARAEIADRTILIKSFTKSFAMPAWRVGYVVGPAAIIDECVRAVEWDVLYNNHVAQAAAVAAMSGSQDWLRGIADEFQSARDTLLQSLRRVDWIRCTRPGGGPFLFLDIAARFASSEAASKALLEVGVPTTPGHYFQSDRHVRLAFGAPKPVLEDAVMRIAACSRSP